MVISLQLGHWLWCRIGDSTQIVTKSRIRKTKNLSTVADSRTDTIFERLSDLSHSFIFIFFYSLYFFLRDCVIFLKKEENKCGLFFLGGGIYYPHGSRDSLSSVCGIFTMAFA